MIRTAILILLLGHLVAADSRLADAQLAKLKAASVFVKVHAPAGERSGSGFMFRQIDGQIHVLTNDHVVRPDGQPASAVDVVLASGMREEQVIRATVLCTDPLTDLAILSLPMARTQPLLELSRTFILHETDPLFVLGFPFGSALAVGEANPSIT